MCEQITKPTVKKMCNTVYANVNHKLVNYYTGQTVVFTGERVSKEILEKMRFEDNSLYYESQKICSNIGVEREIVVHKSRCPLTSIRTDSTKGTSVRWIQDPKYKEIDLKKKCYYLFIRISRCDFITTIYCKSNNCTYNKRLTEMYQ